MRRFSKVVRIDFNNGRQNATLFQTQFPTAMDEAAIRNTASGLIVQNFSL